MAFWKYWFELRGVISSHMVRTPLPSMTKEEEVWLKERVEMLEAGVAPTERPELRP